VVLFTIACETCASRLNVKQQAAIGQVLACPKCGSMVHVQPPEGWHMPESAEAPPKKPRPARDPHDPDATLSGELGNIDPGQKPVAEATSADIAGNTARHVTGSANTSGPPVQDSVDLESAGHWDADGSGQRGQAAAWIAGVIGICLVSLVLILYMISRMIGSGDNPVDGNRLAEGTAGPAAAVEPDQPATGEQKPHPGHIDAPSVADQNTLVNPPVSTGDDRDSAVTSGDVVADDDSGNREQTTTADNATAPESANRDVEPVLDEEAAIRASRDAIAMDQDDSRRSILDEFAGIGDLVFNPGIDVEAFREAASDDPTHKYGIGKIYVPVPDPLDVDPRSALEEVYPGLAFTDQSLMEFSRNLFCLTQVPVQLDGQAIVQKRLDPLASVSARGEDIPVKEILNRALKPLDLVWNWNGDQTVIVITARPSSEIAESTIALDPVLGIVDDEIAARLMQGIQLVIAPESWSVNGGPATIRREGDQLVLEQTADVADQVSRLIEKLTLAARLKADPGDSSLNEQLSTLYAQTAELREQQGGVFFVQLQPVQKVLNQLHREDGMTLIVNWDELLNANWNPNVMVPWLSEGLTLEKTLRELTLSMGLAYRMLDHRTLEITSKQKYWRETRLEIYACGRQLQNRFTGNQIIEFLKEGIAADLPNGVYTQVLFSPDYDCVVALLPDPLHIRIERILNQLAERE
jgi:hypothetical protein